MTFPILCNTILEHYDWNQNKCLGQLFSFASVISSVDKVDTSLLYFFIANTFVCLQTLGWAMTVVYFVKIFRPCHRLLKRSSPVDETHFLPANCSAVFTCIPQSEVFGTDFKGSSCLP